MTTHEAIKHYTTQTKLANALGIKQGSVSGWGEYPPALRQLQLQRITNGKLKAEPGILSVSRAA
jgi:transcriptional repressor of cell division inhibition gene dicB